jgi:hypothetical protein
VTDREPHPSDCGPPTNLRWTSGRATLRSTGPRPLASRSLDLATARFMTPHQVRRNICNYLIDTKELFAHLFEDGEEGLRLHVENMRKSGTWATELEVTAASHLLLRPIHLITDHADESAATLTIEPPMCIAVSAWGAPIYLAHYLDWHFEGTLPVVNEDPPIAGEIEQLAVASEGRSPVGEVVPPQSAPPPSSSSSSSSSSQSSVGEEVPPQSAPAHSPSSASGSSHSTHALFGSSAMGSP